MADTTTAQAAQTQETAPATETTAAATSPAAKDPQLEQFARKERQLRKMQVELQQQKAALEARAKQYETDYIPKSKLKEDPWSILQAEGMDYEQLTNQLLQQPQDPATKALMAKIKHLEDKQLAAEKAQADNVQQQYQQAIKQIGNEVKLLTDADPEYESIKAIGASAHEAVVELIERTYNETGTLMDVADAAKQVETALVEDSYKMAQLKKVQAKLKPAELKTEETKPAPKQTQTVTPKITTLSNQMQTQPSKRSSDKERRERALAAFHGKLNN